MLETQTAVQASEPKLTPESLESFSTIQLRQMVRQRGVLNGPAVSSARKADLIALLTGGTPELHQQPQQSDDLADIIAAAVSDRVRPGLDVDAVREIIQAELADVLPGAIAQHAPRPTTLVLDSVERGTVDGVAHECLPDVIARIVAGIPVLLVGPTGSGKTHLARQVAQALGLPFSFLSLTAGVNESALLGRLIPDASGAWCYHESEFVRAYRDGGVFLFDEIDAADPNMLLIVNAALANGHLAVPVAGITITRNDRFVPIAAANTWGTGADAEYVGRAAMDASTLDRYLMGRVVVGYSEAVDRSLVRGILRNDQADSLLAWAHRVRAAIETEKLRRNMSTRAVLNCAALMAGGKSLDDVKSIYFQGWTADERKKAGGQQ